MRITFGSLKGKNIIVGKNANMRPTEAKAKSVIFNTIAIDDNDEIIDLFSGTGSLGFESVSLGAKKVYLCDNDNNSYRAIKDTIKSLNLDSNNVKVFNTDFRRFLIKIDFKPSIIFIDPPFIAKHYYDEALKYIFEKDILKDDGVIILEKLVKDKIIYLDKFEIFKQKKLGGKEIIFLKKAEK